MLEAVGNPIVVNPDAELAAIAEERQWAVRHFESAVTLRDKLPSKEVAAGAAVASGIAAVLAYWAMKGRKS